MFFAMMQLNVKTLTGKNIKVECEPSSMMEDLAQKISDKEGIPTDQLLRGQMVFGGKRLEPGRTVADYDLRDDSSVDLVLMLHPGSGRDTFKPRSSLQWGGDGKLREAAGDEPMERTLSAAERIKKHRDDS